MKRITLLIFLMVCAVGFSQDATVKKARTDNPINYDQKGTPSFVLKPNVSLQPGKANVKSNKQNNPTVLTREQAHHQGTHQLPSEFSIKGYAAMNPERISSDSGIQNVGAQERNSNTTPQSVAFLGSNNPVLFQRSNTAGTATFPLNEGDIDAEVLADAQYRSNNPTTFISPVVGANRPMSDIIPTAGATETFTPSVGDHFFDPGGPGGSSTGGTAGNYPNCGCATQTTLMGVSEINFQFFSVFSTWDYLKIYDGVDATGTVLYDNGTGGANQGDITLADMIASNGSSTFISTSGNFFFYFHASAVVDYGGWDAEIIAAGGGGGGDTCSEENPNDGTFENGFNCSSATAFMTANDVTVAADEDFTLTNITASIFANGGITNVDVNYYADASGLPGALIGSQASVTIDSQTVIGTNFGFDVNEVELSVDPFLFAGQSGAPTTYWIELSVTDGGATGSVFWVVTSSTSVGNKTAQFDAAWTIADPLMDGVYIWEGICEPMSGGGGDTCSEENPNDGTFENGFNCSSATAFMTANDVTVAADEDFTLTNITASIFANGGITNVDVNYYADASGLPGALIGSQASVTIDSQTVIGTNFGFDVNEVELSVDPFLFAGQSGAPTTYWIELSVTDGGATGSVFWVVTSSTSVGNKAAQFDAAWTIADPLMDGVYMWEGICEPMSGGGGDTCSEENPNDMTFENGFNCSSATAFMTANDVTVAADEDFTLTNITASIFANGGITNVAVNYYSDTAGLPGTLIGSQASATIDSQTVIGTNFGFDVNEVKLTVDPFLFAGQSGAPTTYWIELSVTDGGATGSVFWVVTSSTSVGNKAAQFDAAWTIADPLMDGVYIWEGICEPMSGGGGDTCSEENPNDMTFENGFNCSSATAFMTANDVTVAADEDFTLTNITASIFANGGITNVDVNYYADASGLPGALIGSQASVTIDSQTVIGTNFGFDVNEIELSVDPFLFAGQSGAPTTYWIELSVTDGGATGSVFWVVTSSTSVGNKAAQFDAAWTIADPLMDGVYIWEGICEPIGGGGDTCSEENPNDGTFENGFNCSSATAFMTANDVTVAADEDFTLTNITASIFANGGITNVDVNYYADASGLPGTLIGSQASVTIDSQTVIGTNFGFDVNEIELSVDPFLFTGQSGAPTTYWIELSVTDGGATGSVFWVVTSSTSVGNKAAQFDTAWTIADPLMDGVYIWEGICEPTTIGIVDNSLGGFNYYPNPTSDVLNISADKNIESVSLFNLLGQKVMTVNIDATSSYLNLADLSTGTYIMKVAVEGQIGTYKIIKN